MEVDWLNDHGSRCLPARSIAASMSSNMSILAFLPFSACTQMCPFHDHVDFIPAWFLARFISLMFIVVKSSLIPFPLLFSLWRLVRIFWQWSRRKKQAIIVGSFPSRLRPIRWAASKSWARSELISRFSIKSFITSSLQFSFSLTGMS